jgi:hypothetical protein
MAAPLPDEIQVQAPVYDCRDIRIGQVVTVRKEETYSAFDEDVLGSGSSGTNTINTSLVKTGNKSI